MTNTPILASARHRAADNVSRRRYSLSALPSMITAWGERIRFRWKLAQLAKDSPHLIDDIGLTGRQVEAEIIKRFWQR